MTEEQIISLRRKVVEEQYGSVFSPITYVAGKRYHFAEQEIPLTIMISILLRLPKEFIDLPAKIAKIKYPSENRPQYIKSSTDTTVNFALTHLKTNVKESDIIPIRDVAMNTLKRLQPQNDYLGAGCEYCGEERNHLFSWYEYCGPALDDDLYSLHAFLVNYSGLGLNGLLYFLFNCRKREYESWRPIVFETIATIREKPLGWNAEEQE